MKIRLLMITHNRPAYTRLSLSQLCAPLPDNVLLTIWDNGSSQDTRTVLKDFESHRLLDRIIYSETNDMLLGPTNWFWDSSSDADFVAKVDDDGLLPTG